MKTKQTIHKINKIVFKTIKIIVMASMSIIKKIAYGFTSWLDEVENMIWYEN